MVKPVARFTHAAVASRRAVHEESPRPFRRVAPVPVNRLARSHQARITPGALEANRKSLLRGAEERRTEVRTSDSGDRHVGGPPPELRLGRGGPPCVTVPARANPDIRRLAVPRP